MKTRNFLRAFSGLLLLTFAVFAAGCNDNDDNGGKDAATLTVNPDALELGAEAGASATFTITTTATWTATVTGEGFTLDKTSGTGDAVVSVTASAANDTSEPAALGSVTIKAEGVDGTKSVAISQRGTATEPATLTVNPDALELGATAGASATFTITTTATWTATVTGEGFTLDKTSGTGDAVVSVTASAANNTSEPAALGSVMIKAEGVDGTKSVSISQQNAPKPDPTPSDVTIVVDFAEGPTIATPALPSSSADALSGRHEYSIKGYTFAIYADGEDNGKFYWTDNSQYYPMPEPNKGLFFSKTGAYVEFPVVKGQTLTKIGYAFNNGAGELPEMDITTPNNDLVDYMVDYADDGSGMTFTLLNPVVDTAYRLILLNRKNAQVSKFVLYYTVAK